MLGWINFKLETRLLGEISITSDTQSARLTSLIYFKKKIPIKTSHVIIFYCLSYIYGTPELFYNDTVYKANIAPHLLEIPFKTSSSKMFRCNKTKDNVF